MASLIAIDPGDVHVGVAFFETVNDEWREAEGDGEWECVDTQEFTPDEFVDALAETIFDNGIEVLVYERFRLYGDKSREQIGSEFPTAQLIGVIKYLVRVRNAHVQRHEDAEANGWMMTCELTGGQCQDPAKRPHRIEIVGQMADIKKPTTGILRTKKVKSTAKAQKTGGHCFDAELHGYYYILHGRHNA